MEHLESMEGNLYGSEEYKNNDMKDYDPTAEAKKKQSKSTYDKMFDDPKFMRAAR